MKYHVLQDGEKLEVDKAGEVIRFACCDCGLVHQIAFALEENEKIGIAIKRDHRSTGQKRRWMPNNGITRQNPPPQIWSSNDNRTTAGFARYACRSASSSMLRRLGKKTKLLPKLLELFPNDVKTFIFQTCTLMKSMRWSMISKTMIREEQNRQRDLKKCESERLGVGAFCKGCPCVPPVDEIFPHIWRKGWKLSEQQMKNKYSAIYRRFHNMRLNADQKGYETPFTFVAATGHS